MEPHGQQTRRDILQAALHLFANNGYAGTGVQDIAETANVTKPCLYYHFRNKADLFTALVDYAHDERYRLMQSAAKRADTVPEQLEEILAALFCFLNEHTELMRLTFSTAFAASGEVPPEAQSMDKCRRNFGFIHELVKEGLADEELNAEFGSEELAMGIYGLMNIHAMAEVVMRGEQALNRDTARRTIQLFLNGARKQ